MAAVSGSHIQISPTLQALTNRQQPARIAIKEKGTIHLIDPGHVLAVKAEGHYLLLELRAGSRMLRGSIAMMSEKLGPYGFVRIHRSLLVNAAFVEEIQAQPGGEHVLRIKGGKEYTVSRTYKKNLHELAGSWIGTEGFALG